MFLINNSEKDNTEELKIIVSAKNINVRIEDSFNLLVDPELRAMRIEQEKNLEKQRKLAKKQKLDEIKRKKAEKLLQKQEEQKEKEEAEMLAKKAAEELLREQKEKKEAEMLAKKQAEELLKKQKEEAEMLAKKQMEKLLVQKKETELDLIEEKKQKEEELTALKTVTKPKKIEEKKLAKLKNSLITELKKINLIQIKKEENTLTKLEEIDFNNQFTQLNFEKNLDDAKKIEEVINKVFAPLDLESKIALTKILLKDAIKPEIRKKNETSNNKFNNQLLFLERLLDHVGIDYTKKNIDEKN